MRKIGCFILTFLTALGFPNFITMAATTTGNMAVTATVLDTCIITTGAPLTFASVAPAAGTNETTPSAITLVCTATRTGLSVAMGGGGQASGGVRRMIDGLGNFLPYFVDSDAAHTAPVAINGTIYSGGITAAVPVVIAVYGQIPTGSYTSGTYSDTVVVTLSY